MNEKDIALNLPESTRYTSSAPALATTNSNSEQNLNIKSGTVPAINTNSSAPLSENSSAQQVVTSTIPDQAATKNQITSAINKSDANN